MLDGFIPVAVAHLVATSCAHGMLSLMTDRLRSNPMQGFKVYRYVTGSFGNCFFIVLAV
jgi:hypothetical protein